MSQEQFKIVCGVVILFIILTFIVIAIISHRETKKELNKPRVIKDPIQEVKIELPKHRLIYELNRDLRQYYIATDFALSSIALDRDGRIDIYPIIYVDGVVSTRYINKYSGEFIVASLFNLDDVIKNVIIELEKRDNIEIESINNNPSENN